MSLIFVQSFKAGKLDLCEEVGLDGGSLELCFKAKVRGTPTFAMCLRLQKMCQEDGLHRT
jgi:predicted metal-binding protein